ncbi:MAG: SDR family oxidoreductase [Pseudomonadota bacterium]
MDLGIADKKAVVLASTRGLGRAIAEALAADGAHVLLAGRSAEKLQTVARDIRAAGGRCDWTLCDLAEKTAAQALDRAAEEVLGQVDILVLNAGGPPPGRMIDADLEVMRTHFETSVMRLMEIGHRFVPAMAARGWGRVVAVGSSGVIQPIPALGLSNAIRASLAAWCKSVSNDVAAAGVTVNMLLPGRIHTERVDELDAAAAERTGRDIEAVRAASIATIPAGRYGSPAEFAAVAAFLCSAPASYVTGSLVRCDGGQIKSLG